MANLIHLLERYGNKYDITSITSKKGEEVWYSWPARTNELSTCWVAFQYLLLMDLKVQEKDLPSKVSQL